MSSNCTAKLWGGRFSSEINSCLMRLNCSLPVDRRLFSQDLDGSIAYATALEKAGLITENEREIIHANLELIRYDWVEGLVEFLPHDEDVHSVNERLLVKMCGEIGKKLHTGRSRNDQVVTDFKLWMKKAIKEIQMSIKQVIESIIDVSEKHLDVLFPGYTHLQRAQPVVFGHWLLCHGFAMKEDYTRFTDSIKRVDTLPLGSGAIAGNPLGIDRELLAELLGFSACTENSMHSVGDRDFVIEFLSNASLCSLHLSRLAEDLIIYCSKEFNFITIAEEFSTGSSLMPQKRNPDSLELVRGLTGQIFGEMASLMMTIKGLPSTYNKDLQFDKKSAFNCFDELKDSLTLIEGIILTMKVNKADCHKALSADMLATDWAYYLVKKGVPFRSAHHFVGKVVALAEKLNMEMTDVPLPQLKNICTAFDEDISTVSNYQGSVDQNTSFGGTSVQSIRKQIVILKEFIAPSKVDNL